MKKQQVLIFFDHREINHIGGPSGYLLPLLHYKNKIKNFDLHFLNEDKIFTSKSVSSKEVKKRSNFLSNIVHNFIQEEKEYRRSFTNKSKDIIKFDFSNYDVIIFHSTHAMFMSINALNDYKGTVILQSHSPKPTHKELLEDVGKYRMHRIGLQNFDKKAFERANYIVFPCKEAMEPYLKWRWFKNMSEKWEKNNKIIFLITGCLELKEFSDTLINYRDLYNIPYSSTVFTFIGRHSKVKGYFDLIKIAKKYKNRKDIYFLICGDYGKIRYPKYNNWIEVGFCNNIYSILNSSDFYLSLNKDTYFDLSVIEALSCGTPTICSNTGGNKKIIEMMNGYIFCYNKKKDFCHLINRLLNKEIPLPSKKDIYELYLKHFSASNFVNNFEKMITTIINR